jgi:hypothetical protein
MTSETRHPVHYLTVNRRTYRRVSKRDRRRRLEYTCPEIKLRNSWLKAAGFESGDRVCVSAVEPGLLAIVLVAKREPVAADTESSHL